MKTSSEVIDAINELELRFPVQSWRVKDIDLWPAYRISLYTNATSAFLLNDVVDDWSQRIRLLAERGLRSLWRVPRASWRDRSMNARPGHGKAAVFLSDGMSFTKVGDTWFDRIVDPLILALEKRGFPTLKLTPLPEAHVPRFVPSCFIQPAIDRIKLVASVTNVQPVLPQFDEFLAEARAKFGALTPDRRWLAVQASRLDRLAAWFARILSRSGASHAFVNTYYSLEGLAFIQGARRARVRSIDLQHGIQGPHHVAYARWANVPNGGYSTLPDEFWVWSAEELDTIEVWQKHSAVRSVRVAGNPWLARWRSESDGAISATVAQARALRGAEVKIQALACLTWGVAEKETDKLIDAAKLCGSSVEWWWRLHPVESRRSGELAARLEAQGLDGSSVAQATDLPLYSLFRATDIVLAHSSTVVREAAQFGIPSVITSDYGAELHTDLILKGVAIAATDARAIADAMGLLTAKRSTRPATQRVEADPLPMILDQAFQQPAAS